MADDMPSDWYTTQVTGDGINTDPDGTYGDGQVIGDLLSLLAGGVSGTVLKALTGSADALTPLKTSSLG